MNAPSRSGAAGIVAMAAIAALYGGDASSARPAALAADAQAAPCTACHGVHGEGMAAAQVPRLAGQAADYLEKQLDNYADGSRGNPIMRNFAKALSRPQRAQLAARYAAMSAPYSSEAGPIDAHGRARGQQLAHQGDETKRVQACNGCHGPDGRGVPRAAPYLAGQSAEYLAGALKAFRQGARNNDAGQLMRSVAQRLDDGDIAAVAGYFASLGASAR